MASEAVGDVGEPPQLRAALQLAEVWGARIALAHWRANGWCSCGGRNEEECSSPAKHPYGGNGWQARATAEPEQLRALLREHPDANIGIATGTASGIIVLDVDGPEGEATLAQYEAKHGPLPPAPEVRTARGRHIYFTAPAGIVLHNRAGARGRGLGPGLDLRAEGGFAVCPPSVNVDGVVYVWREGRGPNDVAPPITPDWIIERAREQVHPPATSPAQTSIDVGATRASRWAAGALDRELEAVRHAPVGTRNLQLNTSAFNIGMLCAGGQLDASESKRALVAHAMQAGLSELEAQKTVRSGFAAGFRKDARSGPTRDLPGYGIGSSRASSSASESPEWADDARASGGEEAPSPWGKRYATADIFAPLPEQRWMVEGLQIGPGRPTLFVGFGGSAKTLAAQSLALSAAAGREVWARFACAPQSVLHLDYEQGGYASCKRYQRLAIGQAIDPRELENRVVYAELPRVYLDKQGAADAYMRACEGFDIVIVDSLRGAAPFTDENDSSFRGALDVLTYVSTNTGCCFIVLHHAGKPRAEKGQPADARIMARGSGAIFDAAGCVFNFQSIDGVRLVRQAKTPAESTGNGLDLFELVVEDIRDDGVRVTWARPKPVDEASKASAKFERDAGLVLAAVAKRMGGTANQIVAKCGLGRSRALDVLKALADEGRLELHSGPNKSKLYRVPAGVTP